MASYDFMKGMPPGLMYPAVFEGHAADFFTAYALEALFYCPAEKVTGLTPRKDRVCRFCVESCHADHRSHDVDHLRMMACSVIL